jgi:antitoxin VapB
MKSKMAKLFQNGRSQAVRLPKEFRFEGTEVRIRRHGAAVILEPVVKGWDWLDTVRLKLDADVIETLREPQPEPVDNPALDRLFR